MPSITILVDRAFKILSSRSGGITKVLLGKLIQGTILIQLLDGYIDVIAKLLAVLILCIQVVGVHGNAGQANYAASKAGLIGLTKSVARELASRGICVNAVAPGFIATDMTECMPDSAKQGILGMIPMGKMGTTEQVASAVVFLAGGESDYITGQILCVDGGMAI